MFYVMQQRTRNASHPDANVYDLLNECATYEDALEYVKRIRPELNTFIVEIQAIGDYESIFDYKGNIYEY